MDHVKKYIVSEIKKRKLTIISQIGTARSNDLFRNQSTAKYKFVDAFAMIAITYPEIIIKEPASVCGKFAINRIAQASKKQMLKIKATFDEKPGIFTERVRELMRQAILMLGKLSHLHIIICA